MLNLYLCIIMNLKHVLNGRYLEAEVQLRPWKLKNLWGLLGKQNLTWSIVVIRGWRLTYGVKTPDGGALGVWPCDSPNVDIKPVEIPVDA